MNRKWIPAAILAVILCVLLAKSRIPDTAHASQNEEQSSLAQEVSGDARSEQSETSEPASADEQVSVNESEDHTAKMLPVFKETLTDDTVEVRFYKESPNVPYMGIARYFDLMLGGGLQVQDNGDGTYILTNAAGAQALVDTEKGIISAEDLPAFENYYGDAREGKPGSFKDSAAPYLRLREVVYEGDPKPVQFDLGHLGISIHGDGSEVWLPVSVLSSWLSDIAQNRVVCNGNCLYICRDKTAYELDNSYYSTEYFDKILAGADRDEDLAAYCYADLGFIFQYMYGYPGRTKLDPEILRNEGFDEALAAFGEAGQELRTGLASKDFREFWFAMYKLSDGPLEDGHNNTALTIGVVDAEDSDKYKDFREYTWSKFDDYEVTEFVKKSSAASNGIYTVRPGELSEQKYYKSGDTAVILLNSFSVDENGWNDYYQNGGDLPEDTMGVAAEGLMKAAEDGKIRNVLFDLSTNPGGYSDAVMGVISLMTGRDYLCGYNELSEQGFRIYFDVDRNLDGEIDEKDDEVSYNFNYAVMTSNASFSCGNMFPFLVKDEGGMVIGDRSGGGSCSIQKAVLSEGFDVNISGYKFKLTDNSGSDLEAGVTPDIQLEIGVNKEFNEYTGAEYETYDYSSFGDLDAVCSAVSGWFTENKE